MLKWKIVIVILGLIQSLAANAGLPKFKNLSEEVENAPTLKKSFLNSSCHQAEILDGQTDLSENEEAQLDSLIEAIAIVSESDPIEYCLLAGEFAVRQGDDSAL